MNPHTMIPLRRAPNGAPRVLFSSLTRPSHRPTRITPLSAPTAPTRISTTTRFSSTAPPPSDAAAAAKTPPTASPTPAPQSPDQQQGEPRRRRRRITSLRPLILSTLFLAAGLVAGNIVRFTIAPPPLPDPGTDMDDALQEKLRDELDALPVVREYEARVLAGAGAGDSEWAEVAPWGTLVAASRRRKDGLVEQGGGREGRWFGGWLGGGGGKSEGGLAEEVTVLFGDEQHAVSQTLAAMKAFGPARRFVNKLTRESVTVFWLGGGLTGWPGVAHGGALATAFLEAFGSPEQRRTAEPAKLTLTYLAPTMSSNFFVLKAAPSLSPAPSTDLPPQKDMTKRPVPSEERPTDGGEEWSGTLQAVQGRVCVKANAVLAQ